MRLCILCEDAKVVEARERSAGILPIHESTDRVIELKKKKDPEFSIEHLNIPLSATGEFPATHWFCFVKVDEATYQEMLASQLHTIIEEAVPSEFLEKYGLKKIKTFGPK
ncbi:hypothetical protein UFOVP699_208 [uncultured Caudovirales phage]|uniref:Uncharacterized protein n=1 Tax=uncultured Caudovirales phage TaxID=2100421 RepID=A0A6J5NLA5_9CAUD|nr:hypothetical protein UFOVP699_208 [uncultured Caudovirales phage]